MVLSRCVVTGTGGSGATAAAKYARAFLLPRLASGGIPPTTTTNCVASIGSAPPLVARRPHHHHQPQQQQVRHHMSHGDGSGMNMKQPSLTGPRTPAVELGLDAARHAGNVLRLLESSHGYNSSSSSMAVDTISSVWHPQGLCWWYDDNDNEEGGFWTVMSPIPSSHDESDAKDRFLSKRRQLQQQLPSPSSSSSSPRLLSLTFSDDRTALAKVVGVDGCGPRYVSLVRLDEHPASSGGGRLPNDGWLIVREVMVLGGGSGGTKGESDPITTTTTGSDFVSLYDSLTTTLHNYLNIEHGGGHEDCHRAQHLFAPQASLLAVGTEEPTTPPTDWSAPVGTLLEIPKSIYQEGVVSQSPHEPASRQWDTITTMDVIPSLGSIGPAAAAATVRVGNGAQTRVFEDHLLLGWCSITQTWTILSKVFSPQPWP